MVRIVVAGRHKLMREGIKSIVGARNDCAVVAEASDGRELMQEIYRRSGDLLMLEPTIAGCHTAQLIRSIQQEPAALPILICESRPSDQQALDLIRAGARGYVSKTISKDELLQAIRRVASGYMYVGEALAEQIALNLMCAEESALPHARLSKREEEVFLMLANGLSVTETSKRLNLSVKTVSTHKARLLARMGLRGTSELILYAIQHNLIAPPVPLPDHRHACELTGASATVF